MDCKYGINTEGRHTVLSVDCHDCLYGMSLEESEECMRGVMDIMQQEGDVDSIVLKELLRREYDGGQVRFIMDAVEVQEETRDLVFRELTSEGCEECEADRRSNLNRILEGILPGHPAFAYGELLGYLHEEEEREDGSDTAECVECEHSYVNLLKEIRGLFEAKGFFQGMRGINREDLVDRAIYKKFLSPSIRPQFSTSRILLEPPPDTLLISTYRVGDAVVRIYLPRDKPEHLYFVTPSEYGLSPEKFEIINRARALMIQERSPSLEFTDFGKARRYFRRLAKGMMSKVAKGEFSREEIEKLAGVLTRYTAGLGILEVLLEDPLVRDIYINAPVGETPLCINHAEVEDCVTNIYLTEDDVETLISRFRARSGRAFSEAHPVLDLELPEFGTRVATIGKPLSPDGLAFALRRQKPTPWTLLQFVANTTINAQAAGLLSFLIDGQVTMLVTGSRGSGKTSFLVSLLGELMQGLRVLTIEDTLEIPVHRFNEVGYRMQRLKIRSAVGRSETEMTPQEALGTALRLGESVLVIGEVRGPETKVLYESMRVGSAGNAVLGTIHGASAESVFDRVVYDIGIPASSFKATDVVVTVAPIRRGGGLRSYRRVLQISEVSKDWRSNEPDPREIFQDLMTYDPASDALEITQALSENSELVRSIARKWNLTYELALENIELRARVKQHMVDASLKNSLPGILELEHVVRANNRLRMLNEEQLATGEVNYQALFDEWRKWFDGYVESVMG